MSDEVLVGKLVADRYRVVRRLGAGGMGIVYVAIQEPLGREVALKVVNRDLSGDQRTLERFRREALSLSQAHHPHIVTLHDFGELPSGALYFAMELVRGENLRQRLIRTGPLPVKKTLGVVRDAASALAAAHALGIIHRDLKPENILLMEAAGRPDFVKLVDFGVAKLTGHEDKLDAQQQEALTARGSVVGTPGYIPPEVALHGITTDPRSDLYALGVVWFEALTGRPPFRAATATSLLMAHAIDPVPPLPEAIPLPVAGLVLRLLAKNPGDRPETAEELAELIDTLPPVDSGASVPRPVQSGPMAIPLYGEPSSPTMDDSGGMRKAPRGQPLDGLAVPTNAPTAATPHIAPSDSSEIPSLEWVAADASANNAAKAREISGKRPRVDRPPPPVVDATPDGPTDRKKAPVPVQPQTAPPGTGAFMLPTEQLPMPTAAQRLATAKTAPSKPYSVPPSSRRPLFVAAGIIVAVLGVTGAAIAALQSSREGGDGVGVKPGDLVDGGRALDAGVPLDAGGKRADAGQAIDAGQALDAGVVVDAGPRKRKKIKKQGTPQGGEGEAEHEPDIYSD